MNPFDDSSSSEDEQDSKKHQVGSGGDGGGGVKGVTFVPSPTPLTTAEPSPKTFLNPFDDDDDDDVKEEEEKVNPFGGGRGGDEVDFSTPVQSNQKTFVSTEEEDNTPNSAVAATSLMMMDPSELKEEEEEVEVVERVPSEPWQFQWKRPELHHQLLLSLPQQQSSQPPPLLPIQTTTTTTTSVTTTTKEVEYPINSTSARLLPSEQSLLYKYIYSGTGGGGGVLQPPSSSGGGGGGGIVIKDEISQESSLRLWENMLEEEEDNLPQEEEKEDEKEEEEEEEEQDTEQDWIMTVTVLSYKNDEDDNDDPKKHQTKEEEEEEEKRKRKELNIGDALLVEVSAATTTTSITTPSSSASNANNTASSYSHSRSNQYLAEEQQQEDDDEMKEEEEDDDEESQNKHTTAEKKESSGVKVLFSRKLRWPSSALIETLSPPSSSSSSSSSSATKTESSSSLSSTNNNNNNKWNLLSNLFSTKKKALASSSSQDAKQKKRNEAYQRKKRKLDEKNLKNKVGLVSVSLCRRSKYLSSSSHEKKEEEEEEEENVAEALDVLRFLTFGMGSSTSLTSLERGGLMQHHHHQLAMDELEQSLVVDYDSNDDNDDDDHKMITEDNKEEGQNEEEEIMTIMTNTTTTKNSQASPSQRKKKMMKKKKKNKKNYKSELVLCCLTNNGQVHVFPIMDILKDNAAFRSSSHEEEVHTPFLQQQQQQQLQPYGPTTPHSNSKKDKKHSKKDDDDDDFFKGLATLLLGRDLHDKVMDTMLPLSHPRATVSLSAFGQGGGGGGGGDTKKRKEKKKLAEIQEEEELPEEQKDGNEDEQEDKKKASSFVVDDEPDCSNNTTTTTPVAIPSFDFLSAFDATIEPSTVHYRTIRNVPTICSPSFEYVAIGGWGVRKMKRRVLRRQPQQQQRRQSSSSSMAKDRKGKMREQQKQQQEETTTKKKKKWEWEEYNEIGGFVTFISLKHYSETRTVYLPFAPKQMSPIIWENMHFLVILGDEGRRSCSRHDGHGVAACSSAAATNPMAVAVRVDSFLLSEPTKVLTRTISSSSLAEVEEVRNEAISTAATSSSLRAVPSNSAFVSRDELNVGGGSTRTGLGGGGDIGGKMGRGASQKRLLSDGALKLPQMQQQQQQQQQQQTARRRRQRRCNVRRFKPLPILLPAEERKILSESTEKVLASVVSVTSMLTSPPAIAISYTTATNNTKSKTPTSETAKIDDVYLALHTMCGFEYVPANSIPMEFGGVRTDALLRRHSAPTGGNKPMMHVDSGGSVLIVRTKVQPGHMARIPAADAFRESRGEQLQKKVFGPIENHPEVWCVGGQGWSIAGFGNMNLRGVYFISWEGAVVSHGAHVTELLSHSCVSPNDIEKLRVNPSTVVNILPTSTSIKRGNSRKQPQPGSVGSDHSSYVTLPFTTPYHMPSFLNKGDGRNADAYKSTVFSDDLTIPDIDTSVDGIVIDALDSITNLSYFDDKKASLMPSDDRRRGWLDISHREKSKRLLRRCSSWTQLDDTEENRALIDGRVIVATMRLGDKSCSNLSLTLRKNVVTNGVATPFHEVLAWLCQRKDYFTAASVALSLLDDFDALRDLRGSHCSSGDDHEKSYLEGLLDGIIPLEGSDFVKQPATDDTSINADKHSVISNFSAMQDRRRPSHCPITSLADMAVGCLVRGGTNMSKTLEGFLGRNIYFDASRASLMLVATISSAISDHTEFKNPSKANDARAGNMSADELSALQDKYEDIFWPIRCLLQIAVKRDCMVTALLLLNATIPNEMRRKKQRNFTGKKKSFYRPPLILCKSIITMIVESSSTAAGLLLSLADEYGKNRYWQSLDHDTRLAFSLISVRGKYPLLREAEVRAWAVEQLVICTKASSEVITDDGWETTSTLPSQWLKDLCSACLSNAGSNIENLYGRTSPFPSETNLSVPSSDAVEPLSVENDGVYQFEEERKSIKSALSPSPGLGGLDFDLMIPALLILQKRSEKWNEDSIYPTQSILNELCDLAGRYSPDEPAFAFDGVTVMKLCAIGENVQATANLIGGQSGLVLKCADVLMTHANMTMDKAERYLLTGEADVGPPRHISYPDSVSESSFHLTDGHRQLLSLIEEHILSVKTYGDFETIHIRGRVEPVFASRVCLRAWLCLMRHGSPSSGPWLVAWLREKLGIRPDGSGKSKKRLACAALCRALLWHDDCDGIDDNKRTGILLADSLGFEPKFWIQLAQACCGLIEAIPPSIANKITNGALDTSGKGLTTNVMFAVK